MFFRCGSLLFLCSACLGVNAQNANMQNNLKCSGNPIESFVYKQKKPPKSLSDKDRSALFFLQLKDKAHLAKKAPAQGNIDVSEVFILETVNGEPITNIDVINIAKLIFFFSEKPYDNNIAKMMFPAIIASLEDDVLRKHCAKLFEISVSEEDIDAEIAKIAQINGINEKELEKGFLSSGISLKILREHIKSRLIFQMVSQSMVDEEEVTKSDLDAASKAQTDLIANKRYFVAEIFRHDKGTAEKIRQLAAQGFDFQALAENLSQTVQAGQRGAPKWYKITNLEPEVATRVAKMQVGTLSEVIKTKSGYKIVYLVDIADAGKVARSETTYKFLKAEVLYKGKLYTKKDVEQIGMVLRRIAEISDINQLKEFCSKHNIGLKEEQLKQPNNYYANMIQASKESGKPIVVQSEQDKTKVNIVMFESEEAGKATMPSQSDLRTLILAKRMDETFAKNFKKLKAKVHISKNIKNIQRMTK